MDPRIADYIRANRRKYTREAITKQLVEAGHDPGEIERTWAALDTRDPDAVAGEGFWGRFALIAVGINLVVFVGVALLTGMLGNVQSSVVVLVILAIVMGLGALIAWGLVAATGPTKLSPTTATVVGAAIPALFALLIGGSCYALIGSMGGLGPSGPPPVTGAIEVRLEGALDVDAGAGAFCQTEGPNAMFVHAEVSTAEGRTLFISINAFTDQPGAPVQSLLIEAPPMDGPASFPVWGSDMGPPVDEMDWTVEPLGGRVAFSGLPGMDHGEGDTPSALPSLSGEISWTCQEGG